MTDWTHVDDRLPGETAWVLVYADEAIDCVGYEPDLGFSHWHPNRGSNVRVENISHWMPLPKPPDDRGTSGGASSGREAETDGGG